jgi:diguanylate cyclase (GGDEF)-like protein
VEYLEMVIGQTGTAASSPNLEASPWTASPSYPGLERPSTQSSNLIGQSPNLTGLWQQALAGVSLSTLFQTALSLATTHLQVKYGSVWKVLSDSSTLRRSENIGWSAAAIVHPEVSAQSRVKHFLQVHQPTVFNNQTPSCGLDGLLDAHSNSLSGINIPILSAKSLLGFLEVHTDEYRTFDSDDIDFLQSVTQVLAIAIERKRSEELLQIQTQVLEKISSGAILPEIFHHLCLLLEAQSPTTICSILLLDETLNQLRQGVAPSFSENYLQAMDGLPVGEGMASCGTAAHRKAAVFVNETIQDPLWENFQELAHHIQACWSVPFFAQTGALLGTVALSHSVSCAPTPYHLQILETATYLAAIAVERHQAAEELKQQALYDALTGLPNRVLFMEHLKQRLHAVQACRVTSEPTDHSYEFAVLFLDVDHFKLVNDSLGHNIGDQLLIEIVRLVKRCIRTKDTFSRLGGDEFAVQLDTIGDVSQAQLIADRIRAVLSFPLRLNEHEVFTSVSIGIAHSSNGYSQPEELLRDADTAMYRAKAQGRAHYAIFDKEMHTHALSRLHMEMDLRHVVEDLFLNNTSQLQLYYQPIVSLSTDCIVGFEALIRWFHPERGLISPAEFIPVAEETGLIVPIGRWVLHEACNQLRRWQEQSEEAKDLIMSINVSSRQLLQPDFILQISQILQATQISTSSIKLEITESVLMETAACVTDQLVQMQDLGVRFSLDDFGTGYSSLNYLYRFPINTLKVDRSFVDGLGSGQDQIVQTIIALAHGLGMDVTAEGVETPAQLAQLKALGCEFGQGYLFSRPVDQQAAKELFTQPLKLIQPVESPVN